MGSSSHRTSAFEDEIRAVLHITNMETESECLSASKPRLVPLSTLMCFGVKIKYSSRVPSSRFFRINIYQTTTTKSSIPLIEKWVSPTISTRMIARMSHPPKKKTISPFDQSILNTQNTVNSTPQPLPSSKNSTRKETNAKNNSKT
jgi:hypothetical protein